MKRFSTARWPLFLLSLAACRKEATVPAIPLEAIQACHAAGKPDSSAVVRELAGTWKLDRYSIWDAPETRRPAKNVIVRFSMDGGFAFTEDDRLLKTGRWRLARTSNGSWQLDAEDTSGYTYGNILLCDGTLLFNDSGRDGYDHLFLRVA